MGQESKCGLVGSLWFRVCHKVALKVSASATVISRLSWKRTHFQDHSSGCWQVLTESSLKVSDPCHLELTTKQASKSVSMIEVAVFLYLNLRSDISSFLPYYGRESLCPAHTQGDGITEGYEYQDAEITEGILKVAYHPKNRTKACTSFNSHLDYTSQSRFPVAARVVLIKCRQELLLISANPPSYLSTTSAFQVLTSAYLPTLIPPHLTDAAVATGAVLLLLEYTEPIPALCISCSSCLKCFPHGPPPIIWVS